MTGLIAICILLAVVLALHACATAIADSEDLHTLTVRVHTLRNEYLASLRGEVIEVEPVHPDAPASTEPVAAIGPDAPPAPDAAQAA